eukprot:Em0020g797a
MLFGYPKVLQSLMGTLLTWGVTAAGAGLVFVLRGEQRKVLDASLGFAAGVMLAATFWSLLEPAIEMADLSGVYGAFAFVPVVVGFVAGAAFVYLADVILPHMGVDESPPMQTTQPVNSKGHTNVAPTSGEPHSTVRSRGPLGSKGDSSLEGYHEEVQPFGTKVDRPSHSSSWRRILLLIIAITIHNIPEGLAVGVAFGAIGKSPSATLESARNLAIGIAIQNFPEGLAVSLPLRASGMGVWWSFWYGQLSGMVEPIAGLFGTVAVVVAEPLLPYALAFAGGAMVFVVVDDIIPEGHSCGNGRLCSVGVIVGFIVMMSLDVGLG